MKSMRLLAILLCGFSCSHAADLSLRINFPGKIVVPRPPDQTYQTNLQIGFVLKNEGQVELKLGILERDVPTWYAPMVAFKLVDRSGKEIQDGFQPTENFSGGKDRREIGLGAGQSVTLPYYQKVPFFIRTEGTYTLSATARVQDENKNWIEGQSLPVTFVVEWSDEGGKKAPKQAPATPGSVTPRAH